jgi:hypothetical protein
MSGYIGTQPVPQATQTRDAFTATNNQTSFPTSGYTPEFLDVFLNGVKLAAADYTATNGSDVVLAAGATTGDILEVVSYGTFEVLNPTFDGNVTFTGNASFGDNDKAIFGDDSDLQIYHSGSHGTIKSVGGNNSIFITPSGSGSVSITNSSGDNIFTQDGDGAYLRFGGSQKLVTTSTGIDVTGTALNLDGGGSNPLLTLKNSATYYSTVSHDTFNVQNNGLKLSTQGTERMRIDSSGDVRIGSGTASTYVHLFLNGASTSNYGPMIELQSAGTAFGKISNYGRVQGGTSTDMFVTTATTNNLILGTNNAERMRITLDKVQFNVDAKVNADNSHDLGAGGARWKDLYLSGGVYLGGTGSANKLDDFETGTFAPVLEGSVSNPSYGGGEDGRYTKVGNIVHFSAYVDANPWISNGSGEVYFAGLPFTVDGNNAGSTRNISMSIWGPTLGSGYSIVGQPVANSDYLKFALWGDNRNQVVWTYATASFSSGDAIYMQGHYYTSQ